MIIIIIILLLPWTEFDDPILVCRRGGGTSYPHLAGGWSSLHCVCVTGEFQMCTVRFQAYDMNRRDRQKPCV